MKINIVDKGCHHKSDGRYDACVTSSIELVDNRSFDEILCSNDIINRYSTSPDKIKRKYLNSLRLILIKLKVKQLKIDSWCSNTSLVKTVSSTSISKFLKIKYNLFLEKKINKLDKLLYHI